MSNSSKPTHVSLAGIDLIVQEETYLKELQTPFNPRFSTGDPNFGDLSYFQYASMEDWSGGSGQEVFDVSNQFFDSENVDVTVPGQITLSPKIEFARQISGPTAEQFDRPVEDEDAWPQITEWLGSAIIYNDDHAFDAGGLDFLEVYDTEIISDQVINSDVSGQAGVRITDVDAEIISISKVQGLPGESFTVTVKFNNFRIYGRQTRLNSESDTLRIIPNTYFRFITAPAKVPVDFYLSISSQLEFLNEAHAAKETRLLDRALFSPATDIDHPAGTDPSFMICSEPQTVTFTMVVPNSPPGIYYIQSHARGGGGPFRETAYNAAQTDTFAVRIRNIVIPAINGGDTAAKARVLFYIKSVDTILVKKKNLYAPQLKAATVVGSYLVGGRVFNGVGYVEVYAVQSGEVVRILQLNLTTAGVTPAVPTYMQMIGSDAVVILALDNRIYKVDILTSALTAAQRFTFIGTVAGTYVSGLSVWNQRTYIASFSKSTYVSTISWTNGTEIQGSYTIDGKFWITDLANFNGGLFYSGGKQDGVGQVRLYPAQIIANISHPVLNSRVRTLNAGRFLYFGQSHKAGVGVITEAGVSSYTSLDFGDSVNNVVWDIEEVGGKVFFLVGGGAYRTNQVRFQNNGYLETSEIGGNTPLISKIWVSVILEVRDMIGTQSIKVSMKTSNDNDAQWQTLGAMFPRDGIQKEFTIPAGLQAQWVRLRLDINSADDTKSPKIKRLNVKYVPSILNKFQWAFTVRATNGLRDLAGNRFGSSGEDIRQQIWNLKNSGILQYTDVDDQVYDVIITDIKEVVPLIEKNDSESLISVELLEA